MPDRAAIRDWVRQHTLIEADDYEDAKVDNVINQAIRDVATQFNWPWLEKTATITLVSDQANYALPADYATTAALIRSDSAKLLSEVNPKDAWMRWASDATADKPTHFYLWEEQIWLAPTPSGASLPDVYHKYYREPVLLANDTDVPEFASQFHLVLAEYAASKVWEREEDTARSQWHLERYYTGVERMARFYLNRAGDYPLVIGSGETIPRYPTPRMPWLEV